MDFGHFLLFTQRLRKEEFHHYYKRQNQRIYARWPGDSKDYFEKQLDDIHLDEMDSIRVIPFGEILKTDHDPYSLDFRRHRFSERFKVNCADDAQFGSLVDGWLQEWHEWHLKKLEPICNTSLFTKIGRQMYLRQYEKKLAALHVASHFIRDGDQVAIPEGSSAFYVGMAIAKLRRRVSIITSNDPLIRETRDNPSVAKKFNQVLALGGFVDFVEEAVSGHGGVFGDNYREQFIKAILKNPGATVVILPVYKLLKTDGPVDTDHQGAACKFEIITESLRNNVRKLIFVADYTKHAIGPGEEKGIPQFSTPAKWKEVLDKYRDRVAIVTCPPPNIRMGLKEGKLGRPIGRPESELLEADKPYNRVSHYFAVSLNDNFAEATEETMQAIEA